MHAFAISPRIPISFTVYAFARKPCNDAGTASGNFPSLCMTARMAAMYP
jgi:hypothetical protein